MELPPKKPCWLDAEAWVVEAEAARGAHRTWPRCSQPGSSSPSPHRSRGALRPRPQLRNLPLVSRGAAIHDLPGGGRSRSSYHHPVQRLACVKPSPGWVSRWASLHTAILHPVHPALLSGAARNLRPENYGGVCVHNEPPLRAPRSQLTVLPPSWRCVSPKSYRHARSMQAIGTQRHASGTASAGNQQAIGR